MLKNPQRTLSEPNLIHLYRLPLLLSVDNSWRTHGQSYIPGKGTLRVTREWY